MSLNIAVPTRFVYEVGLTCFLVLLFHFQKIINVLHDFVPHLQIYGNVLAVIRFLKT